MREKLIELLRDVQYLGGLEEKIADHLIENGVVIPVRCKDCEHWNERTLRCKQHSHYEQDELNEFDRDYFCAYGERKDNG